MLNSGLAIGWNSWQAMVSERRAKLQVLRQGLGHWHNRAASAAWMRWAEVVVETLLAKQAMRSALGHMLHRQLSAAFNEWKAWNDPMLNAELRRIKDALQKGWNRWLERVVDGMRQTQLQQMLWSDAKGHRQKLLKRWGVYRWRVFYLQAEATASAAAERLRKKTRAQAMRARSMRSNTISWHTRHRCGGSLALCRTASLLASAAADGRRR